MYTAEYEIKGIAKTFNIKLEVDSTNATDYIDCIMQFPLFDIYIVLKEVKGNYYAYGVESTALPRELYTDILPQTVTYKERSDEIINNVKALLLKEAQYHIVPRFFNSQRGYVELKVDGKSRKVWQKRNTFNLPRDHSKIKGGIS